MSVEALASSVAPAHADVLAALHNASAQTGSDFNYLLGTAMRESGLDSQAKSKASSATGLFQFIDQTWLGLVKKYGEDHGLGSYAGAIHENGTGHYSVDSKETKQAILALRKNPELSALMAGEAAKDTKQNLECALGREVCGGELYAAHFLGEGCAKRLIALNESNPKTSAASEFPEAARANRSIFYHADGSAKSIREVYNWTTALPDKAASGGDTGRAQHIGPFLAKSAGDLMARNRIAIPSSGEAPLPRFATQPWQAAHTYLSTFASRAFSNIAGTEAQKDQTVLPQRPLLLSPGIVEILASMAPMGLALKRR